MRPPVLHNVTLYVERARFDAVRAFYAELAGTAPVWEEPGHIACFGTDELALCVHEEEPSREAGAHEFFFWVDETGAGDGAEVSSVDPEGNHVRLHRRP